MKRPVVLLVLLFSPMLGAAAIKSTSVHGQNEQTVVVDGTIDNRASNGGLARVNIGSVVGSDVGGNRQAVHVSGSIVNEARGSGKADVNIGSVVDGEK